MKTIEISQANAVKAYKEAKGEVKTAILNLVGAKNLSLNITDRLQTEEDCFLEVGVTKEEIIPYKNPINKRQLRLNSLAILEIIIEAHCEGWIPDYTNTSQYKYEPVFKYVKGSGFVFATSGYGWACASTGGGSRRCLPTSELSEHVATRFQKQFNDYLSN